MSEKKVEIKQVSYFDEHWYKIFLDDDKEDFYPSTTTKLSVIDKPGLLRWYSSLGEREARKRMNEAADRGSRIHHAAQTMAQGGCVVFNDLKHPVYDGEEMFNLKKKYHDLYVLEHQDEMLDVWKIKQFFSIVKPIILGCETIVYTTKYREAGTIDLVIKLKEDGVFEGINGKDKLELSKGIWICDYKTGNIYDEARMQLASYGYMLTERHEDTKKDFQGALILHTGSKTRTGIPGFSAVKITKEELAEDWKDYRHTAAMWERKNKNAMPRMLDFPSLLTLDNKEDK